MPASQPNPPNRYHPRTWVAWGAVVGLLLYVFAFFSQPSLWGFTSDVSGEPLPRWYDLLLVLVGDQLLGGLTGHGRFEATLSDRFPILLGGLLWLGLAWATARWTLRWADLDRQLGRLEVHSLAVLIGLAVLSTATLLIGLGGGLGQPWPLLVSVLALSCGGLWLLRICGQTRPADAGEHHTPPGRNPQLPLEVCNDVDRWTARLLGLAVCGLGLLIAWGTLITPYEFDVVEYHLQAPKEYWQAGAIRFNERNVYANMPLGAEMHSLAAMTLLGRTPDAWWWGGLVGKFIIGSYTWLAALLLGGFIARHLGAICGWASAGCLLAVPGSVHVATAGLIDNVLGAYLLALVVVWSLIWPRGLEARALGLTSLLAGAAAAAKYPGLIFAVLPLTCLWFAWEFKHPSTWTERVQRGLAVLLGLAVTCLPWLAKNSWQTGNPVYPLMASLFGGRGLEAGQIAQWRAAHAVPAIDGSSYSLAAVAQALHHLAIGSTFHSPVLIGLAACGLLVLCGRWRQWQWLAVWPGLALWILLVWFVATHRIDRFWLPVVPLYAGLAAAGVHYLGQRLTAAVPATLVLLAIAYTSFLLMAGNLGDNRLLAPLDELRHDAGTEEGPGRMPRSTGWVNNNLNPSEHKLLLIGEARAYDFVLPIEYATCFNPSLADELLRDRQPTEQRVGLANHGITHILIHWGEIARYRSPGNYGFSPWPEQRDIQRMIEDRVVEPVHEWPLDEFGIQLLRVLP
jgi:hypothetical protein